MTRTSGMTGLTVVGVAWSEIGEVLTLLCTCRCLRGPGGPRSSTYTRRAEVSNRKLDDIKIELVNIQYTTHIHTYRPRGALSRLDRIESGERATPRGARIEVSRRPLAPPPAALGEPPPRGYAYLDHENRKDRRPSGPSRQPQPPAASRRATAESEPLSTSLELEVKRDERPARHGRPAVHSQVLGNKIWVK